MRVLFLILLCLLSVSCSRITVLRTRELVEVQNRVDSLRNDLMTIDENWQTKREEEARREEISRISVELTLNSINEMLRQLSGNVAESQTKISEISRRTDIISTQMAERARQDSLLATMKELERIELFSLAKSNYTRGNFALAIGDFEYYLEKYPETDDAQEALFLLAESNYALDSLDVAETLFRRYYTENRGGAFACGALYKLGLIYDRQGKNRSRDRVWGQLNEECSDSPEARLVRENHRER